MRIQNLPKSLNFNVFLSIVVTYYDNTVNCYKLRQQFLLYEIVLVKS